MDISDISYEIFSNASVDVLLCHSSLEGEEVIFTPQQENQPEEDTFFCIEFDNDVLPPTNPAFNNDVDLFQTGQVKSKASANDSFEIESNIVTADIVQKTRGLLASHSAEGAPVSG